MKPVRLTPRADSDIDACFAWIAKDNPVAALRFLDAIELTCDTLSRMPGIGSPRYAEIPLVQGVRMLATSRYYGSERGQRGGKRAELLGLSDLLEAGDRTV